MADPKNLLDTVVRNVADGVRAENTPRRGPLWTTFTPEQHRQVALGLRAIAQNTGLLSRDFLHGIANFHDAQATEKEQP